MAAQASALAALDPFILLSKSANSARAARDLVVQATSHSGTYVFSELLATPNIQSLRGSEHEVYLTLLEIFAWGTYDDYLSTPNLPPLTPPQLLKLRHLTLLSLPPTPSSYSYTTLQSALHITSTAALEGVLISALYASLLTGKLSPATQTLQVHSLSALRDVAPNSVDKLVEELEQWAEKCEAVLGGLEGEIQGVKDRAEESGARRREREEGFERAVGEMEKGWGAVGKGAKRGVSEQEAGEVVEVEEEGGGGGKRKASRRAVAGGLGGGKR
ncbi:MAG: hypothetical protein M1814_002671 [Vezdaea aestivalis]|nr:MAG: hypothetical protein M1814_002671 [Vezdaea aestivalis]